MPIVSLDIADGPGRMPFTGILTRLDEPSDNPPNGANGKRVLLTSSAAARALESLLGMGIGSTPLFDGHDPQAKIGVITSAGIFGSELHISGFVYADDFPLTAEAIQDLDGVLGLSFEAQRVEVEDRADVLEITELMFTGAAVIRRDRAAYSASSFVVGARPSRSCGPQWWRT